MSEIIVSLFEQLYMVLLSNPISWLLGLLDYGFLLVTLMGSRKAKFFSQGYGPVDDYHSQWAATIQELGMTGTTTTTNDTNVSQPQPIQPNKREEQHPQTHARQSSLKYQDIDWGRIRTRSTVTVQEARFRSPIAQHLPSEAQYCQFYLVQPTQSPVKEEGASVVYILMLPATGEQGISERLRMAQRLANRHGWSSVLVTAPYYKERKPKNQTLFFLPTVADMFWQGYGVIREASALALYFLHEHQHYVSTSSSLENNCYDSNHVTGFKEETATTPKKSLVCLTGFSFGAAMAFCTANWSLQLPDVDGQRLAVCSYVGCTSPCVLADGVLQHTVDWLALKKTGQTGPEDSGRTNLEAQRRELHRELSKLQLNMIGGTTNPAPSTSDDDDDHHHHNPQGGGIKVVKAFNMKHDAFIKPRYALELESQIRQCLWRSETDNNKRPVDHDKKDVSCSCSSNSPDQFRMQWLPGGHIFAALARPYLHTKLLVETVQELQRVQTSF